MTQPYMSIDGETRSRADLRKCGAHVYFEDPSTDVLCVAYRRSDWATTKLWKRGDPVPRDLATHIESGGECHAWNAAFERLMFRDILGPKYGFPVPKLRQWRCTMVRAYHMNLPGKLEDAAPAVGLTIRKDAEGARIMLQLCKPRRNGQFYEPHTAPYKFGRLYEYCIKDVDVEFEIGKRLVHLSPDEQELWFLDQKINDRGVYIDINLVEAADKVVRETLKRLDAEMREVTGGEVASCNAVAQIKDFLVRGGLEIDKLDKDAVENLLARDDLTNTERTVIELRKEAGKTSTAKLNSFRARRSKDGSIKGTLQFHGAAQTGRWAARGVQVQNFPRPDPNLKTNIPQAIEDILEGDVDWIRIAHGPPMTVVADCLRPMITARPGRKLWSRDLSQIEARTLPWLAGEWKIVDAFAAYDRKEGPDIYVVTAAGSIYGKPYEQITKDERQCGKVATLALGFGGGAGAFASMAKIYRVDVGLIYPKLKEMATPENIEKCDAAWDARGHKSGISKERWKGSELVKLSWRDANPNTVLFWRNLEDAAIDAVLHPGETYRVGLIQYRKTGSFLRCILPSTRSIFYPYARVVQVETPWGSTRPQLRYKAVDGYTRKFIEHKAYGGLLAENVTQATARDVMVEGILNAEERGYATVMTVHDENLAETWDDYGDEAEFHKCMTKTPWWAKGLPIAADGWMKARYMKED